MRAEPTWSIRTIDELSARELHALLKLRVDVFVVEQACAYPEVDDLDALPDTLHLLVHSDTMLIGTARAMAPKPALSESESADPAAARIGRVAVHPQWRGHGLARQMMRELMQEIECRFGCVPVVLSAQTAVLSLYRSLGFDATSKPYLEDGIEHVDMRHPPLTQRLDADRIKADPASRVQRNGRSG